MRTLTPISIAFLTASIVLAQQMDDLRALRMKLSAGDLPSAESILEVHRAEKGKDAEYLMGVAWLARGAALTGDWLAASTYAQRAIRLATPHPKEATAIYALGTGLEVQAQALVADHKKGEALKLLEDSIAIQSEAPFNLRARLWKRWNQIALEGAQAPPVPGLDEWRGKPVVLFFWAEWCGDCKAQAPVFRRIVERYQPRGVIFAAPTRFYTDNHDAEKQQVEKVWREIYGAPQSVSLPIGDAAMLRYGVSATPTFTLIDRQGVVRLYSPTRMSEERLAREIEKLLK